MLKYKKNFVFVYVGIFLPKFKILITKFTNEIVAVVVNFQNLTAVEVANFYIKAILFINAIIWNR